MNLKQKMRAVVDKMHKAQAKRMPMPTGGDARATEEAMNTGAMARGMARMGTAQPAAPMPTVPLKALQQRKRGRVLR